MYKGLKKIEGKDNYKNLVLANLKKIEKMGLLP